MFDVETVRAIHGGNHRRGTAQLEEITYGRDYAWRWGLDCTAWDLLICDRVRDTILARPYLPTLYVEESPFTDPPVHFTYTGDFQTASIDFPPSPPSCSRILLEYERKKKLRSFTKNWRQEKISPGTSFSIILSSRSLLPEWEAFYISNTLFTDDQAKRVCDCMGHCPSEIVGREWSYDSAHICELNR